MVKFQPSRGKGENVFLFKTKAEATKKAKSLRSAGFRAEVDPTSRETRKDFPELKFVAFKGQKKRKS